MKHLGGHAFWEEGGLMHLGGNTFRGVLSCRFYAFGGTQVSVFVIRG